MQGRDEKRDDSRDESKDNDHHDKKIPTTIGPGVFVVTGNKKVDIVLPDTTLTVIDGNLEVGFMSDSVTLTTRRESADPKLALNICIREIDGTGLIQSAGGVIVEKPFDDAVEIQAVKDIKASIVASTSNLTSTTGTITVKSVGDACNLTAERSITADNVGSFCVLMSNSGNVRIQSLANNSSATANGTLEIKLSTGTACSLSSQQAEVHIGCNLGAGSSAFAKYEITGGGDVEASTTLTSAAGSICINGKVGDGSTLSAEKKLTVGCGIGVRSALVSQADIELRGSVKSEAQILAKAGIMIVGDLQQSVTVISETGSIALKGDVGSLSQLQGVGLIKVRGDVGFKSALFCPGGKIEITGKVRESAVLTADKVIINDSHYQKPDSRDKNPSKRDFKLPGTSIFKSIAEQRQQKSVEAKSFRKGGPN